MIVHINYFLNISLGLPSVDHLRKGIEVLLLEALALNRHHQVLKQRVKQNFLDLVNVIDW